MMIETVKNMDYKQICEEANLISSKSADPNALFAHAAALYENIESIPETWLIQEIQNSDNSDQLRYLLIEIAGQKNNGEGLKDLSSIRNILLNQNESSVVRQNAVFAVMNDAESFSALLIAASDQDENVAFQSLKAINKD